MILETKNVVLSGKVGTTLPNSHDTISHHGQTEKRSIFMELTVIYT